MKATSHLVGRYLYDKMDGMKRGLIVAVSLLVVIVGTVWIALDQTGYAPDFFESSGALVGRDNEAQDSKIAMTSSNCSISELNEQLEFGHEGSKSIVYTSLEEALSANERRIYQRFTLPVDEGTNRFIHPIQGWSLDLPTDWWLTDVMDDDTTIFTYAPSLDSFRESEVAVTIWPFRVPDAIDYEAYGISSVEEYLAARIAKGYEYASADWSQVEVAGQSAYVFRPRGLPDWRGPYVAGEFYDNEMILVPRGDVIVGFIVELEIGEDEGGGALFENIKSQARSIGDSFCVNPDFASRSAEQIEEDTWVFLGENLEYVIASFSGYLAPGLSSIDIDFNQFLGGNAHSFRSSYSCGDAGKLEIKQNLSGTPYIYRADEEISISGNSAMYRETNNGRALSWTFDETTVYVEADKGCLTSKEDLIAFAEAMK